MPPIASVHHHEPMRAHHEHLGSPRPSRNRASLLDWLATIDEHGWNSNAGEALLTYVRLTVVRPQIAARGLVGPIADHAEATAWEMTWRVLNGDTIRDAVSPWGIGARIPSKGRLVQVL